MKKIKVFAIMAFCGLFWAGQATADPLKVAFVYISPIGDAGWTYQHELGRKAIEREFGDKIETKYIENVAEGPDSERVIRKLASSGYDLIFGTSFGYMNPMLKVAKRFPKVVFEHATGYKTAKNMGNFSPRFYQGRYLSGVAAASKSKKNVIGYLAAFPIPEVIRGINAFTLGAQSINPKIKVKVVWTNSWFDPGKEAEAASSLIAQGADVVTHHTDSVAAVKTANDKGVYAIGYHSNMFKHGEKAQIGAVIHKWDKFYAKKIRQVLDGTWKSSSAWEGINEGMVDFVVTSNLDEKIASKIKDLRSDIVSGNFHPFTGPIHNQKGSKVIGAGEQLDDKDLLSMDYFVKGVEGKVGK
jgi:simple sugar transport system substrate-binding protein